jgi:hypothetical protein
MTVYFLRGHAQLYITRELVYIIDIVAPGYISAVYGFDSSFVTDEECTLACVQSSS